MNAPAFKIGNSFYFSSKQKGYQVFKYNNHQLKGWFFSIKKDAILKG